MTTFSMLLALLMAACCSRSDAQQTIAEIIGQRPELSLINQYMKSTEIFNTLRSRTNTYTFFAPHNRAFQNVSEQIRSIFSNPSMPTSYANNVFSYHATQSSVLVTSVSESNKVLPIQTLAVGAPRLFLVYAENDVYVNGAHFIDKNVPDVSNGILYIIDSIFYEPRFATNAYTYIHTTAQTYTDPRKSTTEFSSLLDAYKYAVTSTHQITPAPGQHVVDDILNSGDSTYMTAFVPSDYALRAFRAANIDRYTSMKSGSDAVLLQKVIESHVIQSMPYHSDVLEPLTATNTPVMAVRGRIRVYRLNDALYVSNNCVQAKVTEANLTMTNGVVHTIDTLLGFVYLDAYTQIKRDTIWLYEFYGSIQALTSDVIVLLTVPESFSGDVPDSQKLTIFAPVIAAYKNTLNHRVNDFDQNQAVLKSQMLQLMIRGVIEITQMANGTKMETLLNGTYIKFYQYGDSHYVEVNYVRAKIVQAGMCVRNGIIHKVDEILGVPCCTIFGEISLDPKLQDLEDVLVNSAQLDKTLDDINKNFTVFAPIDFSQMRNSAVGLSLINDRLKMSRMKNLMLRHVVDGTVFLDTLPQGSTTLVTNYDRITVTVSGNEEYYVVIGTIRIRVVRANMRMKNGVLHVIEQVIFDPTDLRTGQSLTSGATQRIDDSFIGMLLLGITSAVAVALIRS